MNALNLNSIQEKLAVQAPFHPGSGAPFAVAAKRLYDILLSAGGLLVLSPLFLVIAVLVKLTSVGAVFYRQRRIGLHGQPLLMCKFRSMVPRADLNGPLVTSDGDRRVTGLGRFLRRTKLDELPQLWNVLRGEMSLVGPRPEVPKYVARYTPEQRQILNLKPGITDLASLHFRNEEMLLRHADNPEEFYLCHCLPKKLRLNLEYAQRANLFRDTWIILQTVCPYWICLFSVYGVVLAAAFGLSCWLAYDFAPPPMPILDLLGTLAAFLAVQLAALIWRKQCKGLLSYFSLPELRQVATALGLAGLLLLGLWALTRPSWPPPNLIFLDALLALCAISALRLGLRHWRERFSEAETPLAHPPVRVGIVGAGTAGSQVARDLIFERRLGRSVVAFFDDDFQKWHKLLHGIPVVGMPECLMEGWAGKLDEVIIAMPLAPSRRLREISQLLRQVGLRAYTAPSMHSLWLGNTNALLGETES